MLGKITELEKVAVTPVDIRELKRCRKRYYEIPDEILVAQNKERLADREKSIGYLREAESTNREGYAEAMQLAGEALPKLKEVHSLLQQIAIAQNKIVYRGRDASEIARKVNLQPGDNVTVDLKTHIVLTTVNPNADIPKNLEALELLLKDNEVEEVKDNGNEQGDE